MANIWGHWQRRTQSKVNVSIGFYVLNLINLVLSGFVDSQVTGISANVGKSVLQGTNNYMKERSNHNPAVRED
jgi:hypothetical protein